MRLLVSIIVVFVSSFLNFVYWAEDYYCENDLFFIEWKDVAKVWDSSIYKIKNKDVIVNIANVDIVWEISEGEDIVQTSTWNSIKHNFLSFGNIEIKAQFEMDWCILNIKKNVEIYNKIYTFVWENKKLIFDIPNQYREKWKYMHVVDNEMIDNINKYIYFLKNSDVIVVDSSDLIHFFDTLVKYKTIYDIDLTNTNIFILVGTTKEFIKRIMVQYMPLLDIRQIITIDDNLFYKLIYSIYKWEILHESEMDKINLQFDQKNQYLIFAYLTNILLSHWFPLQILWIILITAFVTVFIAFFRQIIGFSVFGLFNPLLFTICGVIVWLKVTLIFFIIALFSTSMTKIITKKIYLLFCAKISLIYIIYIMSTLTIIWVLYSAFPYFINTINFSDTSFLMTFFLMPLIASKIFGEDFDITRISFWFFFFEFILLVFILYFLYTSNFFISFMLSYPDVLLVLFVLNILIWRFTWLQVLEYFRFMPLIRKSRINDEEE